MFDFLKKPITFFQPKDTKEKSPITLADIPPEIIAELKTQFYQTFDFNLLYTPNDPGGFWAEWGDIIQTGLLVIILIKLFF